MKHKKYIEEQLINLGAEKVSETKYQYNHLLIRIYKETELSDIFLQLVNAGAQLQIWQTQSDLNTPIKIKKK